MARPRAKLVPTGPYAIGPFPGQRSLARMAGLGQRLAMPDPTAPDAPRPPPPAVEATLMKLAEARGPAGSICPSEVARALASEWRPLLPAVRRTALRLAAAGRIDILRKGKPVQPEAARGVIRLRAKPAAA